MPYASPVTYRAYQKRYRDSHRKDTKSYNKIYYQQHQSEIKEKTAIWRDTHPESVRQDARRKSHKRRARRLVANGFYTEDQLENRLAFYGWRCYLCGCDWFLLPKIDRTWDHIIPLSKGGANWPANLRPACRYCNSMRGIKSPRPWRYFTLTSFARWSRMIDGMF